MPDPQPIKRLPLPTSPAKVNLAGPAIRYAELHCCTNFSFLEGASHPDELVARATELGYAALAITDRASLAGVVRAHVAAKEAGLKLVIGATIVPVDASPLLLWATDRAAYGRLSTLLTLGRRAAPKGECLLTFDDIARHAEGLLAGALLGWMPGSPQASLRTCEVRNPAGSLRSPAGLLRYYHDLFADRCYAVAELHRGQ
ncbi:MAG TPA: PHP domain-containing protein, partial [Gemmataceae bacterium]|nr:PHP domain-containing protein [Gemmataceae bacterium]